MSVTIDISAEEIAALKKLTHRENDGEAVLSAAREYVRLTKLRELKAASGELDFDASAADWEELELGETTFPR